jgi:hypothetical protein
MIVGCVQENCAHARTVRLLGAFDGYFHTMPSLSIGEPRDAVVHVCSENPLTSHSNRIRAENQ